MLWGIIPILIFFGIIFWDEITADQRRSDNNMELLYSDINGRVTRIYNNHGKANIHLNNRKEKIYIGYLLTEKGEKELFLDYIKVHDSIYSPYSSDSIYVIRGNSKKGYRVNIDYSN
jgi:hypothetical protein